MCKNIARTKISRLLICITKYVDTEVIVSRALIITEDKIGGTVKS